MNYKLLFSDVDGTLLHRGDFLPSENIAAIHEFYEQGGQFIIASGRCSTMTLSIYHRLGLEKYGAGYTISLNGAHITEIPDGKTLSVSPIPLSLAMDLLHSACEMNISCHIYSENKIYFAGMDPLIQWYHKRQNCECVILDRLTQKPDEPPLKFILNCENHEQLEEYKYQNANKIKGVLSAEYSNASCLEYTSLKAGKGFGLLKVCDYLNIPFSNSASIGDGENDISMLKAARFSIAPSNAPNKIKDYADAVTSVSCEEGAVAEAIRKYCL